MELIRLVFALALPWVLGAVWVNLILERPLAGRRAIVLGYGFLLGSVAFAVIMRVIDAIGLSLSFIDLGLAGLSVTALGLAINARTGRLGGREDWLRLDPPALPAWQTVLLGVLVGLIGMRLIGLGLEVIWRPLFSWDASMHWATKAKVWFEASKIVPFVDYDTWLESADPRLYTDVHPHYPKTIPLLQVWINEALGHWDDSLMNLPWVVCAAALGLAFFGQARLAGVGALPAVVFTYFLISLPLLDTHVALAGYADIFLGACYGAAVMAFYQWSAGRGRGQALLALLTALGCTMIKNEGVFWALTLAAGWLMVVLPRRAAGWLALAAPLVGSIALWAVPADWSFAGHSLRELKLQLHPDALWPIGQSFWVSDSWHLLAYFVAAVVPAGLWLLGAARSAYLGIGTALATALILFLILFTSTNYAWGAVHFTAVSRISLHLIPAFAFFLMLVYRDLSCGGIAVSDRFDAHQARTAKP